MNRKVFSLVVMMLAAVMLLAKSPALAQPEAPTSMSSSETLLPTNDTFVKEAKPKSVFGTKSVLNVVNAAKDQNSFIKFNLSGFSEVPSYVKLRLYVTNGGPDGGGIYGVSPWHIVSDDQWLETDLKWNNAQKFDDLEAFAQVGPVSAGEWVEIDVTEDALNAISSLDGRLALGIHNSSSDLVAYSSKEGAHPPELVVDFDGSPPDPNSYTFAPTDDTFVQLNLPNTNFGSKKFLKVQKSSALKQSLLKFDVSGIDGTVDRAILWLYVTDGGPDGGTVYSLPTTYEGTSNEWLENGLKYNNSPKFGPPISTGVSDLGPVPVNNWIIADITDLVEYALEFENGIVSLGLDNNSANMVAYSSKEGANPPALVIVTE